jgi:excisionase family DNA binding protein
MARRREPLRAAPVAPVAAEPEPTDRARPTLTISEAARATGRDRRTVRRWLDAGKLPGAELLEGPTGPAWSIPVADLLALDGVRLYAPDHPGDDAQADDDDAAPATPAAEVAELRAELAEALRRAEVAEARCELLQRIADERAEHLADLRRIVAPLEAAEADRRRGWWRR